jgi:hypothetical protein
MPWLSKGVQVIPASAVAACEVGRKCLLHSREVEVFMNAGHGVREGAIENVATAGQSLPVPGTGHFGEPWTIRPRLCGEQGRAYAVESRLVRRRSSDAREWRSGMGGEDALLISAVADVRTGSHRCRLPTLCCLPAPSRKWQQCSGCRRSPFEAECPLPARRSH